MDMETNIKTNTPSARDREIDIDMDTDMAVGTEKKIAMIMLIASVMIITIIESFVEKTSIASSSFLQKKEGKTAFMINPSCYMFHPITNKIFF